MERSLVAKAKAIQEKSRRASSSQPPGEHSDGGAAAKELEGKARAKVALKIETVQAAIFRASRTLVRLEAKLALLAARHDVSPTRLTTIGLFLEDAIRRALLEHERRKTDPTESIQDGAWLATDKLGALLHIVGEFYRPINRPVVMVALFRRCLQFVPHNSDFEMKILTDLG